MPITAVSSCNNLLDQLIHAREQRQWNCEGEHPRSFEIDGKLELGRLFDRNVGGVGAFQDLSAISAARRNTSYALGRRAENQSHGGCHYCSGGDPPGEVDGGQPVPTPMLERRAIGMTGHPRY